jgi:hypothetical protein
MWSGWIRRFVPWSNVDPKGRYAALPFSARRPVQAVLLELDAWDRQAGDRDPLTLALEIKTAAVTVHRSAGNPSSRRKMSLANSLWGAPRIHGELIKLGIDVGQTTVAK